MTPEKQAEELVEKLKEHDYDWVAQGNLHCVRENALKFVDEIEKCIKQLETEYDEDLFTVYGVEGFWVKVRTELNKIK
jgi:hypothetical protein